MWPEKATEAKQFNVKPGPIFELNLLVIYFLVKLL